MYAHPTNKIGRYERGLQAGHSGADISHTQETPILAVMSGTIEKTAQEPKGYGNYIVLKHNENEKTLYAHLDRFLVKEGQKVNKAQPIGIMGNTGLSSGRHLHFEYLKNGIAQNPDIILNNSKIDYELTFLSEFNTQLNTNLITRVSLFVLLLIALYYLFKNY